MKDSDILRQLKTGVFGRQTVLAGIFNQYGRLCLFDYINSWKALDVKNEGVFQKLLGQLLAESYGANVAKAAVLQLKTVPLVSTIDHHGLLNHPFFLNSNLIFGQRKDLSYLVCLTTAGVSLNNSSWPGSLVMTDQATGRLKRFSFFPDWQKTRAVLAAPALSKYNINLAVDKINKDSSLNPATIKRLNNLIKGLLTDEVLSLPSFSRQASVISAELWQRMFPNAPKVLYLPIEDLVSRIIEDAISRDTGHVLHQLLFTPEGWELVEKYFRGSLGAFFSAHKGSFLFWGINRQGRRVHLHREGKKLVGSDFAVDLQPAAAVTALRENRLYPSSLVCFLVLLYFEAVCLGGFNQVNWLTDIKEKFVALLEGSGQGQEAKRINGLETKIFAEGNLAFLCENGRLFKATGLDVLLAEDGGLYEKYHQLAQELTLGESIESLLPEIYRVITPKAQQDPGLLSLTDEMIIKHSGWEQKIKDTLAK